MTQTAGDREKGSVDGENIRGNMDWENHFLPYQKKWINDEATFAVAEKSRRIGWTHASAYRAVQRRLQKGTDLYFTTTDLPTARLFIEECMRWVTMVNEVAEDLGLQCIHEGVSAQVIRFRNGSRIMAGSSNPAFFRGKGGDAWADEFAFHRNAGQLLKAMHATAMV